jgi:3-oxoacyl-[acyl-carrier-protein] synthase III
VYSAVTGVGIHLPAAPVTISEFVTSEPTGVAHRIKGDRGATTPWLAAGAARAALKASHVAASEIQLVIVGTTSPDVLWPSTACLVQSELGLPMVASFDLYAAEAGLLASLAVADRFVRSGTRAALVIGAESERQLVHGSGQSGTRHGRAASAIVLTGTGDEGGILASVMGGAARPDGEAGPSARGLEEAVDACLARAGLELGQIDLVIGEQTAPGATLAWATGAGLSRDRVLLDADRYRIAFAAAPFIVLHDAVRDGVVRQGTVVLMLSCGTGPVWAATCLRWGEAGIAAW